MVDTNLLVPLWIVGTAAVLFIPGVLIAYRVLLIRRRLDDIETSIWTGPAIDSYLRLFTKRNPEEWRNEARQMFKGDRTKEDDVKRAEEDALTSVVRHEFLAVHSWWNYLTAVTPLTIVVAAVVWTCCAWASAKTGGSTSSVAQLDDAVISAMAGAYVWSVYEILSRFRTRDLTPDTLMEMTLRQIAAVPIGYAVSLLAIDRVAASMAFASAAFPLREVRLTLRQRALKKLGDERTVTPQSGDGHLAKLLDCLGDEKLARLEELQIVTYMDLAYVNPIRLMARTGYSLRHILAWIDHALLAVYAAPHKAKLLQFGIPCSLDAREFFRVHCRDAAMKENKDWRTDKAVIELASALGIPIEFVAEILYRVDADPHVRFLADIWYSNGAPVAEDTRWLAAVPAAMPS